MKLGIIGGSGFHELEGIGHMTPVTVETPYGAPSDEFMSGELHGKALVFLPRHGRGHRLTPSEIPYRANIWAMKKLGVTHLIALSAVGSLQDQIAPGHLVFPDQFIDRTYLRQSTFFGDGVVAHVQFGDPVCGELVHSLATQSKALGIAHHTGGTYVCMEGPAFSTRAESELYRSWGGSVIGMTNVQEAKLAREAELCFATIALATDYDCWHHSEAEVSVEAVIAIILRNVATSKRLISALAGAEPPPGHCACQSALRNAFITPLEQLDATARERLQPLLAPYLQ